MLPGILVAAVASTTTCSELPPALVGSAAEDLGRIQELLGTSPVRPQLFRRWSNPDGGWVCSGEGLAPHPSEVPPPAARPDFELRLRPLEWRSYLNSGYPDDRNDGALWEGRGIATELTGGARVRWKFLSAGFAPVVAWQQNRDFPHPVMTMPGYSPYANPFNYGTIDLPMRFGPDSYWTFDPGQSFARVDVFNVALGFSTENLWWGPELRNSILMTNSGPGFPHIFLGTSHPQDIWIGWLEAQIVWGRLSRSSYFLNDPAGNHRLWTSLTLGYEPRWIRGLFIGFARVFVERIPPEGLPASHYFLRLFWNGSTGHNQGENQLGSLFFRWVFPAVQLEIFGEWGRDDYALDFQDFITQPEHAMAYALGLQKAFPLGARWLRLHVELAHTLEKPTNNPTRPVPIFYTHTPELEGYTQLGQMIGAGIGPQADSQFLAIDVSHEGGRTGVWVERVLRNGRYFYDFVHVFRGEDAEIAGGLRGVYGWRDLSFEWQLGYGHRFNSNFAVAEESSWKCMVAVAWNGRLLQ